MKTKASSVRALPTVSNLVARNPAGLESSAPANLQHKADGYVHTGEIKDVPAKGERRNSKFSRKEPNHDDVLVPVSADDEPAVNSEETVQEVQAASLFNVPEQSTQESVGSSDVAPEPDAADDRVAAVLIQPFSSGWLAAGVGAAGVAASGGGSSSGSGSPAKSVDLVIKGVVTAGAVLAGNDLQVVVYAADGRTELGHDLTVDAGGAYSVVVTNGYRGDVIVRVYSKASTPDHMDEAQAAASNLDVVLAAVGHVAISDVEKIININPLTDIAARKAGVTSDTAALSAGANVPLVNAEVSQAYGLGADQIIALTPVTTLTEQGARNPSANLVGYTLDQISRQTQTNKASGIDMAATQQQLADGLVLSSGTETSAGPSLQAPEAMAVAALAKIAAYAQVDTNPALTLRDYENAGIKGVNASNLAETNAAVASQNAAQADTAHEVQALVKVPATTAVDTSPPTAPTLTLGAGVSDGATVAEATVATGAVMVSAENGATTVVTFSNGSHTVTKTITGTGTAQAVQLTSADLVTLGDGAISVSATATDAAGNASSAGTTRFTLDTMAPAVPAAPTSYKDNVGSVTSDVSTVMSTDDTTPGVLVGNGLTDIPTLYVDGQQVVATYDPIAGTLTPSVPLQSGTHTITYTLTDAVGNESAKSPALSLTVDSSIPTIVIAGIAGDSVGAAGNGIYDGVERGADPSTVTVLPVISGTSSNLEGQTVTVTVNNVSHATNVQTGGAWSLTLTNADALSLNHGNTYNVYVSATNQAGNTAFDYNNGLLVNTAQPDVPTVLNNLSSITTPTLSGLAQKFDPSNPGTLIALQSGDTLSVTVNGIKIRGTIDSLPTGLSYDADTKTWNLDTTTAGSFNLQSGNTYDVAMKVTAGAVTKDDVSSNELVINTTSPTVTINPISTDGYINRTEAAQSLVISGSTTAGVGSPITLTGLDGITRTAQVVAGPGGQNTFSLDISAAEVATFTTKDASKTVMVSVTNQFGLSASHIQNVIIDTGAPSTPILVLGSGVSNGATAAEATATTGAVTVTAEAGAATVVTFSNGANTVAKTMTGTGAVQAVQLSSADLTALGNGTISVSATSTDAAGNASSVTTTSFTLDTSAPATPTLALGAGVSNGATAAEATAITGAVTVNAENGATTVVTFTNGTNTVTKTMTGTGAVQAVQLNSDDLATLGDGIISVSATATDAVGNAGNAGTTSFTLDTARLSITNVYDNVGVPSNVSDTGITNDTTPTLQGTLGDATQGSALASGDQIVLYRSPDMRGAVEMLQTDGGTIGEAPDVGQMPSGYAKLTYRVADGNWVSTTHLPDNPQTGDVVEVVRSSSWGFDVYDGSGATLLASLETDETIFFQWDGSVWVNPLVKLGTATVTVNAGGQTTWTYTDTSAAIAHGEQVRYIARIEDAAGQRVTACVRYRIELDTQAPMVPSSAPASYADNVGSVTNTASTANVTDDTTPGIQVGAGLSDTPKLYVDGVQVPATYNSTTGTLTPATALNAGSHSFSYTLTDAAGNESGASPARSITIDTAAPIAPILALGTGVSNGATALEATAASGVVSVTAEAGATTVVTFTNGSNTVTKTVTGAGSTAVPVVLTSTDLTTLGNGAISASATATDAAGNASNASTTSFTLDTAVASTALAITNVYDNVGTPSNVADTGKTNDTTPTIQGSLGGATAGAALASDEQIVIYRSPDMLGAFSATQVNNGTPGEAAGIGQMPGGYAKLTYSVVNGGWAARVNLPDNPQTGDLVEVVRTSGFNFSIYDGSGTTLVATPQAGETVYFQWNGSAWVNPLVKLGTATVTVNAGGQTTWTYTDTSAAITDGEQVRYIARIEDTAGNLGTTSLRYRIEVDTQAPTGILSLANFVDSGSSASDGISNNNTFTLSLAPSEAGTTAVYERSTDGGVSWAVTTSNQSGLGDGSYKFRTLVSDVAGNSSASNVVSVTIDTLAPTATATLTGAADNVLPTLGNVASGGTTNDRTLELSGTISGTLEAGATLHVLDGSTDLGTATVNGSTWSLTTPALASSSHSFTVRAVDVAGNLGTASTAYTVTVDAAEQVVNTTTTGLQSAPLVVATAGGGYFMVWNDGAFLSLFTPQGQVRGQFFNASGEKVGSEVAIGTSMPESSANMDTPVLKAVALSNGNVVVAWQTSDATIDGSGDALVQSLVSTNGSSSIASSQSTVNTTSAGNQSGPVMAVMANGGYFIAWYDNALVDPAGQVRGQFFDAAGQKIGNEVAIGLSPVEGSNFLDMPPLNVLALPNGHVVVSWQTQDLLNIDGSESAVLQSVVSTNGTTTTATVESLVNTATTSAQSGPAMTATANGGYFTAWYDSSLGSVAGKVHGQFFDSAGQKIGTEVAIGTSAVEGADSIENPPLSVLALSNGNVVVTWQTSWLSAVDGNSSAVATSLVTTNGTTTTAAAESIANTTTATAQSGAVMTATKTGGYFMAWYDSAFTDPAGNIHGQFFNAAGQKIGSELAIGKTVVENYNSGAARPVISLATLDNGDVVVGWASQDLLAIDGSGSAVLQTVVHPPVTAPVVLDLNRDGVLGYNHVVMDVTGDGMPEWTAWVGPQDGVLVWDKLGDGVVHDNSQYAFSQYGGHTDLEGLAATFDTTKDGVFDAQDALFGQFKVWQDTNQNGVSDADEVKSLTEWGITAIELTSSGGPQQPIHGVTEWGHSQATLADGAKMLAADAAFDFKSLATLVQQASGSQHVDLSLDAQANALNIQCHDVLTVEQQTLVITTDSHDVVQLDTTAWINTGTTTTVNEHTYVLWTHAGTPLLVDTNATVCQSVL